MAFAYLSDNGFETGAAGHFDVESDNDSRLDFPHYSTLAAIPGMPAPYRGAYCLRVNLGTSTTAAYVQETGSWDTSADGTIWHRLYFWLSTDVVMANSDEFAIFQLWSSTNTVEAGVYINYTTANGYRVGLGETSASQLKPLTLGQWHCVEIGCNIDAGGGNDGTIDGYLDGSAFTQITGVDQGAITSGVVGVMGQDSGTTRGIVLIDEVAADDARIGPYANRWPHQLVMTTSGHVFVGPGTVSAVELYAGAATDGVLTLYDTDVGSTTDATNFTIELKNTSNSQRVAYEGSPLRFKRGCYVSLAGTAPRGIVKIERAPFYFSDGAIRTFGRRRRAHPLGM